MKKTLLYLIFLTVVFFSATAQTTVSGKVTDENGEGLPGASIVEANTTNGTITDVDGNYSLSVSEGGTLQFSFVGYLPQEVVVGSQSVINVQMQADVQQLEELVVIGYGSQRKENLTGAVSSVQADQLANRPAMNVSTALAGQVPGLTLIQKNGRPGSNAGTIRIRGIGTLGGANNPLVLIDNIEGDLQDVDVNDIESISVLKDAASAAIYGVRAANGVILVTTKSGGGEPTVKYHGGLGRLYPYQTPDRVGAYDYARLHNIANQADGKAKAYTALDSINWLTGGSPSTHPDTDQYQALLNSGEPMRQFHNLSLSGGTDKTKYFIALGYSYEGGLIAQHNFRRINYRVNLSQKISEKWTAGVKLAGSIARQEGNPQSVGQLITEAYRHHPGNVTGAFDNGLWPVDPVRGNESNRNVIAYVLAPIGTRDVAHNDLFNTVFAEYRVIEDIKVTGQITARNDNRKEDNFRKFFQHYKYNPQKDDYTLAGEIRGGITDQNSITWDITSRLMADYAKAFNRHSLAVLLGYEQRQVNWERFRASRLDLEGNNALTQLDAVDGEADLTSGTNWDYSFRSGFGRVTYNFAERYLFQANFRYDGTSRFPKNNRFGFFPSFSAGWRISEENFFNSSIVNQLKLRASWGQLGNQEIGNYRFLDAIVSRDKYAFGDQVYTGRGETATISNPNISWEKTTTLNIGADMTAWEGKLEVVTEYFIKNTDDILLSLPQPLILGAQSPVINAAAVQNTGLELSVTHRNDIGRHFSYHINANWSIVENKITDLKGTDRPGRRVGDPIQNIFGYVAQGLFQNQEEIDAAPDQSALGGTKPQPGDVRYADINGDGKVNADDRKSIGTHFPKHSFGLTLGLNWKFIDFSMVWQGFAGFQALTTGPLVRPFNGGARPTQEMLNNFWTPENPNAKFPRLSFDAQGRNYQRSTYWMQDASFAKLRNAQIGFTLSDLQAGNFLSLQKIRVYFSGENLLHISGFKNIDPEFAHGDPTSWNDANFPSARLFLAGINVTF